MKWQRVTFKNFIQLLRGFDLPKSFKIYPKWYRRTVMPGLLIKDIPREVHEWLKRERKETVVP